MNALIKWFQKHDTFRVATGIISVFIAFASFAVSFQIGYIFNYTGRICIPQDYVTTIKVTYKNGNDEQMMVRDSPNDLYLTSPLFSGETYLRGSKTYASGVRRFEVMRYYSTPQKKDYNREIKEGFIALTVFVICLIAIHVTKCR